MSRTGSMMVIILSDANVIYDTRWDDHIKGSDNDQDIYLTHGSDIIDGAGEVILFISMNCSPV